MCYVRLSHILSVKYWNTGIIIISLVHSVLLFHHCVVNKDFLFNANTKASCCRDSRSYFSLVQKSLLCDIVLRYSYRPLSGIAMVSIRSIVIPHVEILGRGV